MDVVPISTNSFSTSLFYPLLIVATVLVATHYYLETLRIVRLGRKLPGPTRIPFFGNALIALGVKPQDVIPTVLRYDMYGNVARAFLGTKLVVFLADPKDIEIILSSSVHIDKSEEYRLFEPWLGNGLLISTGEKWRVHRKIIAPTFHLNVLKSFVPLFFENSMDLVKRLKSEVGREFDCHDYLSRVTVDILVETAMGVRNKKKDKTGFDYAKAVMRMCEIIHRRHYDLMVRFDVLFKFSSLAKEQKKLLDIIHGLSTRVIRQKNIEHKENGGALDTVKNSESSANVDRKNVHEPTLRYVRDDLDEIDENDVGEKRRLAFLDLLVEMKNGSQLTDEEVKEEVDTIMFEGHDTTAAASSFALSVLATHQDIQEQVYRELDEIFKGSDRPCTFQDTLEMKYLERVILETLRLFPPVPAIARRLNEDVKIVTGDYIIPRGCTVVIPQFKTHRLPEYYPNPEVFNPDNFLPEKMQERHYYAYIPFSAGPRSCVGRKYAMLKLKVLLSTIIRNYKIYSDVADKDFQIQVDIIMKRADGFPIKIEERT